MFTIEKDVPIPDRVSGLKGIVRQTLENMVPGDSFLAPYSKNRQLAIGEAARKVGLLVTTRKVSDTEMRVWLVGKREISS